MRTHYRNGDPITLQANGCDGCRTMVIQRHFIHEWECPDKWRDYEAKCLECGCEFLRSEQYQRVCEDCQNDNAWEDLDYVE